MSFTNGFSVTRWWSMVIKEFIQLRRDRLTLGMIVGIPIIQLMIFGFVINTDPKNLPTAIISSDHSEFTRSMIASMKASGYFKIVANLSGDEEGVHALTRGDVMFVLTIPADFTKNLIRGERPALLLEADATDPTATSMALASINQIAQSAIERNITGSLSSLTRAQAPYEMKVHRMYNPEGNNQNNIVPGLMGIILTLTMVLMTGLAITRERERGTMENILAMPVRPIEVMTGKIIPYIAIGMIQVTIILLAAYFIFKVPFLGNIGTMYLAALLFVAANLTVGITMSSLAQNQLQAMQLTMFYFLPNMLLSGFMFPFYGMPVWAQTIGNMLPLTYFNRMIRSIFLKGTGLQELWPCIWPLILFSMVAMTIAVKFYRRTLD